MHTQLCGSSQLSLWLPISTASTQKAHINKLPQIQKSLLKPHLPVQPASSLSKHDHAPTHTVILKYDIYTGFFEIMVGGHHSDNPGVSSLIQKGVGAGFHCSQAGDTPNT